MTIQQMPAPSEQTDAYFLTDPEIEEMEAVMHNVPDEDWSDYFEAVHVDPFEMADEFDPYAGC